MKTRKVAASLATAALLLVGAASCGSDSDGGTPTNQTTVPTDSGGTATAPGTEGRPSDEKIGAALIKGFGVSQDRADCAAPKISASDLPEASLQSIANNDPEAVSEAELEAIKKVLNDALTACP